MDSSASKSRGTGYLRLTDSIAKAMRNLKCQAIGHPSPPGPHPSEWLNDQVVFPAMDISKGEILTVSIETQSDDHDPAVLCINGPRLGK